MSITKTPPPAAALEHARISPISFDIKSYETDENDSELEGKSKKEVYTTNRKSFPIRTRDNSEAWKKIMGKMTRFLTIVAVILILKFPSKTAKKAIARIPITKKTMTMRVQF